MLVGQACVWGTVGVALVEVHQLWSALTTPAGLRWPWVDKEDRNQKLGYVIAVVCRLVMGLGLNAVYAAAHQIDGPLAAVTIGIAAPLVIKQMAVRPPDATAPTLAEVRHPPALAAEAAVPPPPASEKPLGGVDVH